MRSSCRCPRRRSCVSHRRRSRNNSYSTISRILLRNRLFKSEARADMKQEIRSAGDNKHSNKRNKNSDETALCRMSSIHRSNTTPLHPSSLGKLLMHRKCLIEAGVAYGRIFFENTGPAEFLTGRHSDRQPVMSFKSLYCLS